MSASEPTLFAPFAGAIHSTDGILVDGLLVRRDRLAVTAHGDLVVIDRPSEWPNDEFCSWSVVPLESLSADGMKSAIAFAESVFRLPAGTLSAESLPAALLVAAAAVNSSLAGVQLTLDAFDTLHPHRT